MAPKQNKKQSVDDDDANSVDSKGNIRNLIDYDYDEEDERPKKMRAAAVAARRKIRKATEEQHHQSSAPCMIIEEAEETDDDIVKPKRRGNKSKPSNDDMDVDTDEDEKSNRQTPKKLKKKAAKKEKKKAKKAHEMESETDESESMDLDDDEDDEDYEPRQKKKNAFDIIISDMLGGIGGDPNKPKKYNMKKEPESVKRFVELIQKEDEGEEDTIDNDITYFKSLNKEKQAALLRVLEIKASPPEIQVPLKFKILDKIAAKPELNRIAMAKYNALCNLDPSSSEYYKCSHWITGFTDLPLGVYRDLPVRLEDGPEKCGEFMAKVHKCMDTAIYGHEEAKLQIMQFVSSWIANPKANGNVLSIHGPMGTGKTSLIKDGVAKALERPFHFITLGGATDASFLDGHSILTKVQHGDVLPTFLCNQSV